MVFPLILEPSQRSKVGQKTSIISGMPEPARYRNGAESTTRIEAMIATLFLNQRFSSKIINTPRARLITILGSLMAYSVNPKKEMETCCKAWYGKSTMFPSVIDCQVSACESTADDISASERPSGLMSGIKKTRATNRINKKK